jgi:hypothetical protein
MANPTHKGFVEATCTNIEDAEEFVDVVRAAVDKVPKFRNNLDSGVQDIPAGECCYVLKEEGDRLTVLRDKSRRTEVWVRKS